MKNNFKDIFHHDYESHYLSPARINLIGEHIDYNGGKVLPAAISLNIEAWVRKNNEHVFRFYSLNMPKIYIHKLDNIKYDKENDWTNYPLGMIHTLRNNGYIIDQGLDIFYSSTIPTASGLSSSASLLDLTACILNNEFNLGLSREEIALYAKESENKFNGLACGIMDQAAISLGKKNHAVLIDTSKFDFNNQEYEYHNINLNDYTFVVMSTNKPRKLVESKYNERVDECNLALKLINDYYHLNYHNLCEIELNKLDEIKSFLPSLLYKRVKHVLTENKRVYDFIDSLKNNDIINLGKILNESDLSLKNDYEVTGLHLDTLTQASRFQPSCIGSRMTGAGFGGCAIALIKKDQFEDFKNKKIYIYQNKTNIIPSIYEVDIVDGVRKL